MTVLESRYARARQRHRCSSCGLDIAIGERYRRLAGPDEYDGGFRVDKYCGTCEDLMQDLFTAGFVGVDDATGNDCYPLLGDVSYDYDEIPAELQARLDAWKARR